MCALCNIGTAFCYKSNLRISISTWDSLQKGKGSIMCACVEVQENAAETCFNEMQENQEVWSEAENETEKADKNNDKRENKTNGGTSREDQTVKEGVSHGIYENQYENDNQKRRSKEKFLFDHLPNEIIAMIFETALRSCSNSSNPSDACILFQRLRDMCSRFKELYLAGF